jgi:DNA-binding transcriptional LysR family regulator
MSDLDRLIRFAAVAEELSFSRAAKRLRVDQPWLSRQIQQLEAQLGFPLFVRSTRKVTLTREGEALLAHAVELSQAADRARDAVRTLGRTHSSAIALGVNPYTFWLPARPRIIERFQGRYPHATLELSSNYTPRLISKLRKRSLDAAIVPGPFDFPDLEALVIHRSPPSLLVPPEDPLAKAGQVEIAQLRGRKLAVTDPKLNPAAHAAAFGPFYEAGAEPVVIKEGHPAIGYYAREQRLIMVCVSWPESEQAAPEGFVHVPLAPPTHQIEYGLVRRREPARLLLDQFWKVAGEVAAELASDGRRAA